MTHGLLTICVVGGFLLPLTGCVGGGSAPADPVPAAITWDRDMSADQLMEVLLALDISTPPDATHDQLVATLEQETGCGCFGATCGEGYCGHPCGTCDSEVGESCYSGTCIVPGNCPEMDLSATTQEAVLKIQVEAGTQRFRLDTALAGNNLEKIRIMANTTTADSIGPGTYDLRLFDASICELCVRAYRLCEEGGSCGDTYVATAGKLVIEKGLTGETFTGSLSDVLFQQSYEDPKTGSVYILDHNSVKTHCVATLPLDTAIEEIVVEPSDCDPAGNGVTIGSTIGDFEAQNCLGETVNLHSACGSKAVWVVGAAGW